MFGLFVLVCCVIVDTIIFYNVADNNEYKANFIVEIISIGFTAGIFELIVNYLPLRKKDRIAKKIMAENLNKIISSMEGIISVTLKIFNISKTIEEIALKDTSQINCMNKQLNGNINHSSDKLIASATIYYTKKNKRKYGINPELITYNEYIKQCISVIEENLNKIQKFNYFYEHNIDFVKIISQLSICKFIICYRYNNKNDIKCFLFSTTESMFIDFVKIYKELLKMNYHTEYSITTPKLGLEAENYDMQRPKLIKNKHGLFLISNNKEKLKIEIKEK